MQQELPDRSFHDFRAWKSAESETKKKCRQPTAFEARDARRDNEKQVPIKLWTGIFIRHVQLEKVILIDNLNCSSCQTGSMIRSNKLTSGYPDQAFYKLGAILSNSRASIHGFWGSTILKCPVGSRNKRGMVWNDNLLKVFAVTDPGF